MNYNCLIFGGAGYIGSHVMEKLIDNGHRVCVFDDLSTGFESNLNKSVEFIKGDICEEETVLNVFRSQKFDCVFHFAAKKAAAESMEFPDKYAKNNISGSINILNGMLEGDVQNIVFSSSAAIYGNTESGFVDEDSPKRPTNFYGFSKLEIERILQWYSQLRGIRIAALRYFNAAGYDPTRLKNLEHKPQNLLPVLMEVAMGVREKVQIFGDDYDTVDGSGVRDYIHVLDLTNAHVAAMDYIARAKNLVVNLGTGVGSSVIEAIHATQEISHQTIPVEVVGRRKGDPAKVVSKSDLAKTLLGFEAKHSDLRTILSDMWAAYQRNF